MSKLSETQRGVLVKLAVNHDLWLKRGEPKSQMWTKPIGATQGTLEALERRGLAKVSYANHGYCAAHITDEGYAVAKEEASRV